MLFISVEKMLQNKVEEIYLKIENEINYKWIKAVCLKLEIITMDSFKKAKNQNSSKIETHKQDINHKSLTMELILNWPVIVIGIVKPYLSKTI